MARPHVHGFTLIETIAAVVILTVAMPPMMWALNEAHLQRANPMLVARARWLATEKLEDIVADRHDATRGWAYVKTPGNYSAENPVDAGDYPQFNRSVTLSEHGAWDNGGQTWSAGTGYLTVTVDVDWTDAGGDPRTLSISTIVTDYTP